MSDDEPRWRDAALQARDDLRRIEEEFSEATPSGEDGPDPPIGPGQVWATWARPANTIRWIARMEAVEEGRVEDGEVDGEHVCADCGGDVEWLTRGKLGCPDCHEVEPAT